MKKQALTVIGAFCLLTNLYATSFQVKDGKASFKLPYTLGTHEGESNKLTGQIDITNKTGELSLPIESLKTGNEEMDCHMYEALGINYKNSDFPDDHVCEDDKLPSSGPNSIKYPFIKYQISNLEILSQSDQKIELKLQGIWDIHGQQKSSSHTLNILKEKNHWKSKTDFKISLKDFDIIVKKFLVIAVEDIATVQANIKWSQQ